MVGPEGLQLEVYLVGHMKLQEKKEKEGQGSLLSIQTAVFETFIKITHSKIQTAQNIAMKNFCQKPPS